MPGVEQKGTTRRDFLKLVGVGGLGVASVYVIGCASTPSGATVTQTVTAPGSTATTTKTATVTAPGGTATVTATQTTTQTATVTSTQTAASTAMAKAVGYVSIKSAYCGGCRTCMAACSLYNEGAVWPEMSLTQVIAPCTDLFSARGYACRQCDDAACVKVCPTGALRPDPKTGARVVDQTKCDGCRLCMGACILYPNAPIVYNAATKKVKNCNLCDGDPLCVKFCPQSQDLTKLVTPLGPNGSSYVRPEKHRVRKFVKTPTPTPATAYAIGATESTRWLSEVTDDNWWTFDGRVGHWTPD